MNTSDHAWPRQSPPRAPALVPAALTYPLDGFPYTTLSALRWNLSPAPRPIRRSPGRKPIGPPAPYSEVVRPGVSTGCGRPQSRRASGVRTSWHSVAQARQLAAQIRVPSQRGDNGRRSPASRSAFARSLYLLGRVYRAIDVAGDHRAPQPMSKLVTVYFRCPPDALSDCCCARTLRRAT